MSGPLDTVEQAGRHCEISYQAAKQIMEKCRDLYVNLRHLPASHEEAMAAIEPMLSREAWRLIGPDLAAFRVKFEKMESA